MRQIAASALAAVALVSTNSGMHAANENAGQAVAIAIPLAAGGVALLHDWDWKGAEELTIDTGLTVGTALLLKQIVREQRPDKSDFHSFPSDTAALAFAPASRSLGPLWVAVRSTGAISRQAMSAMSGSTPEAASLVRRRRKRGDRLGLQPPITTRYTHKRFYTNVYATSDGVYANFSYRW